jgi:predicted dehydrogenase
LRRRALYEAGVHLVDVALHLFEEVPSAVRASFSSGSSSAATDSVVLVTLGFSRERLCQITQCRVHRGDRQYLEVRADAGRASFRASFGGRARLSAGMLRSTRPHLALERGGSGMAWEERGASRTVFSRNGGAPLVSSTREVIRACLAPTSPQSRHPFSAETGVDALRVIAAAYLSSELGRVVAPDGRDRDAVDALRLADMVGD